MEPESISPTVGYHTANSHDDRLGNEHTSIYTVITDTHDVENSTKEPTELKRSPDDGIAEDNEIITNTPLLTKTSSLDGEIQQANNKDKDACNSRSDSTSVRFDGILIDVLNSTTIHVDWCPVSTSNIEPVCGYKIRYRAKDDSSYNEIFVTSGISNYTITGLRPNTEYDISVNAVDERDNVVQTCGWVRQKTDELEDGQSKTYEAPYLTAVAAIALLLVAVVVPITFLFVRNCGQCAAPKPTEKPALGKEQNKLDEDYLKDSFRHRRDSSQISFKSRETRTRYLKREVANIHLPILLNRLSQQTLESARRRPDLKPTSLRT